MLFATKLLLAALIVFCASDTNAAPSAPGPVCWFGKAAADDATLRRLVLAPAGGEGARVVVLAGEDEKRQLAELLRWKRVGTEHIMPVTANSPKKQMPRLLEIADVIWIADAPPTDGVKWVKSLGPLAALRKARNRGLRFVAHGRSGAALADWFLDDKGVAQAGLGLVSNTLADPKSKRDGAHGALLAAVVAQPTAVGVRMDETAVVVFGSRGLEVAGTGRITVIDARSAKIQKAADGHPAFTGVCAHALAPGMKLELRK
jgi:cyanophycinase-like exopeptidase